MKGNTCSDAAPLTVDQIVEILESATTCPSQSPGAVLCCLEDILRRCCPGATHVEALVVNRWFNKLLHYSSMERTDEAPVESRAGLFEVRTVCDVGEGIAGTVALTGQTKVINDCVAELGQPHWCKSVRGRSERRSLLCLPVLDHRPSTPTDEAACRMEPILECERSYTRKPDASSATTQQDTLSQEPFVLAILQVYYSSGEVPAKSIDLLQNFARILGPVLRSALDRREEEIHRCEAEALCLLNAIEPRQMKLVSMVDHVVTAAKHLTGAERVCLFFVDDATGELWVAKSADFDGAKVKIGQGLCGHSASTGRMVNVISSYDDDRFDPSVDEKTGFQTKSVLCAPIPVAEDEPSLCRASGTCSSLSYGQATRNKQISTDHAPDTGLDTDTDTDDSTNITAVTVVEGEKCTLSSKASTTQQTPTIGPKPFAVIEILNKRGGGVFDEAEERALARLCAVVECLLRRKAAEVALLKSGMKELSCYRNGKTSDCISSAEARVERSLLQLYSESTPADVFCERQRELVPWGERRSPSPSKRRPCDRQASARTSVAPHPSSGKTAPPKSEKRDGKHPVTHEPSCETPKAAGTPDFRSKSTPEKESDLISWDLDMFELSSEQQLCLVQQYYHSLGLVERFKISDETLSNFLWAVKESYNDKPFHNLIHAVSVAHATFAIIKTTRINSILRPLDKLALLTAAICHDIDHPGNNNDYEVNTLSPLALEHGDNSVLERHHIHITFKILLKPGNKNNILSNLIRSEFREVRHMIQQAILASDMSRHMEHCAEVAGYAKRVKALRASVTHVAGNVDRRVSICYSDAHSRPGGPETVGTTMKGKDQMKRVPEPPKNERSYYVSPKPSAAKRSRVSGAEVGGLRISRRASAPDATLAHLRLLAGMQPEDAANSLFNPDDVGDRMFLVKSILHCADLSGQTLNIRLAQKWGERIMEEFQIQAEMEARAGLPSTTIATKNEETAMKGQHFFLSKIVRPLWESFATIFPELGHLLANLDLNAEYYRQEALRLAVERQEREGEAGVEGGAGKKGSA